MSASDSKPPADRALVCALCGAQLAPDRLGIHCPGCLLKLGSALLLSPSADFTEDLLDPLQVRSFGDYELLEEIARGGMGVVYRARQLSLRREVAVKMILAGELASPELRHLFQREAHAAATLHHPHIVPVYEVGEHETQHYFTMRLVPGGQTIADWAATRRGAWRELAAAVAQAARAVAHAHAHGVLHRDLKPSNILWDPAHGPQVTDFGLAKLLDEPDSGRTLTARALGSPCYMAPEQMDGRTHEITTATDVYGLGAVLYELLAGRPPFLGDTALETMRRAAEEMPAPLPEVPTDLRTVCLKCLAKIPRDRYRSAAALADDLERFARGEPVSAVPLTTVQALWRWAGRRPRIAALLACLFLSLVGGLTGIFWQWRRVEKARAAEAAVAEHLRWQQIEGWLGAGEPSRALAFLASLLRAQPDRWPAAMYAMSIVEQRSFPIPAGPEVAPDSPLTGSAGLAPDGSWYAAACADRTVRVWETASGRELARHACAKPVTAVAVSSGPVALAVATEDGALTLHDTTAGSPRVAKRSVTGKILDLRFSANGSRLLARSSDSVEVWQPVAANEPGVFKISEPILGAEVAVDGQRLFAWGKKSAIVWEIATGRELLRIPAADEFHGGTLAAGGARVAFVEDLFARIWDVGSGTELPSFSLPVPGSRVVALDHEGERLTLLGLGSQLQVFDVASSLPVSPQMRHHYTIREVRASSDGSRILSYALDEQIKCWDARTGAPLVNAIYAGQSRDRLRMSSSRDGTSVLVVLPGKAGTRNTLTVWTGTTRRVPQRLESPGHRSFNGCRISPDGRYGALGMAPDDRAYIFEFATGRVLLDTKARGPCYVWLFSPDARKVYVLTGNGWLHGWSLENGQPLWPPQKQPGAVRPGALSSDGSRIIAGHNDGNIRIYNTADGALLQTLPHPGEIKVLRFAPDGSDRFLSASTDRQAHVWDLATGRKLQTFIGHTDTILSGAWSPDSRFVATASYDATARVWDVQSGRPVVPPLTHFTWLSHLEFSPDGTRLATACRDGTVRLWDPRTGKALCPPRQQGAACQTVRFTADGAAFVIRDHEGFSFREAETGEPLTPHFYEPVSSGLGMDSESWHAMMTPDGTRVFLGYAIDYGVEWRVPQPRTRAPAWFPDFLEVLAQMRMDANGEPQVIDPARPAAALEALRASPEDEFSRWARSLLPTR